MKNPSIKLRCAIIGTGFWANYQIPAWLEIPEVEIVALYNRTESKAEVKQTPAHYYFRTMFIFGKTPTALLSIFIQKRCVNNLPILFYSKEKRYGCFMI